MQKSNIIGFIAVGLVAMAVLPSKAADDAKASAALAKALPEATDPLDRGLTASMAEGTPISGKYEVEDGALQLSIYTAKGDQFSEVIVDHKSGAIKKAEKITDAGDLKEARAQRQAMAKAKVPLSQAVASAAAANAGYRVVSVTPALKGGKPVAEITLMKAEKVKKITTKLD